MPSFSDREKSFEDKFKHDEELQFRVINRRNKLLGLWVADLLGKSGSDAAAYAKEVVLADFDEPGEDDIIRKIMADVEAAKIDLTEHRLRHHMERLLDEAKAEIMKE